MNAFLMRLRDQINQIRWVVLTKSPFELSNLSGWFYLQFLFYKATKSMLHPPEWDDRPSQDA